MSDDDTPDERTPADKAVNRIVRCYLDEEAAREPSTGFVNRLKKLPRQATAAPATAPVVPAHVRQARRVLRRVAWLSGMAAALLVSFFMIRTLSPKPATAASVLRDVQAHHTSTVDRCYQVQYTPVNWDGKNKLEGPSHSVLWTRGQQFWSDFTVGDLHLKLGRETDGRLWLSSARDKGVRFTNDDTQLPPEVAFLCAVNAMSVPRLIDDVLADFELQVERSDLGRGNQATVWATLRSGRNHALLSDAKLVIDTEKNVLLALTLWTVRDGKPKGSATYTLIDSAKQEDEVYRLESYVDEGAKIETHTMGKGK